MICLSAASGLITRPLLSPCFLMYTQIFLVTSVRGSVLAPQIAANASLNFFGAKIPFPAFFMAADCAALPFVRFSALMVFKVAFVIVVFFVVVVGTVVFVVVVMAFNE